MSRTPLSPAQGRIGPHASWPCWAGAGRAAALPASLSAPLAPPQAAPLVAPLATPLATLMCGLCLLGSMVCGVPAAQAQNPVQTLAPSPGWSELSPQDQQVLAPLQRDWAALEPQRRHKWLELARRYPTLAPDEQARMQARMAEWARMSPTQQGQARQQFQASRQLPADELQLRWREYQSLPEAERRRLSQQAQAEDRASAAAGTAPATLSTPPVEQAAPQAKANLLQPGELPPARSVGRSLLQVQPGATTVPLGSRPAPAHHQQTGLPKIAATPGFVDRSTLLPQRGPHGAAAQPASAASRAGPAASRGAPARSQP